MTVTLDSGFLKALLIVLAVLPDTLTSGRAEDSSVESSSAHVNITE